MLKRQKDLLRGIAADLRLLLIGTDSVGQRGDLDRELERLGIDKDGLVIAFDTMPHLTLAEREARSAAISFLNAAVRSASSEEKKTKRRLARQDFIDRAAYTWVNRLLALRVMEARGLIDETLRQNPAYDGISEALYVLRHDAPQRCDQADGGWWAVIEDACAAQKTYLPGLFDSSRATPSLLRPSVTVLRACIERIGGTRKGYSLDDADDAFKQPDAIGWIYQFYQEPAKSHVYAKLRTGGKAETRAEVAAATQLYTDSYLVQWLLQNSLGRSYHELFPNSKLPEQWNYYLQTNEHNLQRVAVSDDANIRESKLATLTLMEPCCGSGHILREAFDMLAAMYREQCPAMNPLEIANRVLSKHLYGINIDPRAIQLTSLTLYLRAWEFVRDTTPKQLRHTVTSYRPPVMNIVAAPQSLETGALQRHLQRRPQDAILEPLLDGIFKALEQPEVIGSLLNPTERLNQAINGLQQPHTIPMDFNADDAYLRQLITDLADSEPLTLKRQLFNRIADSCRAEADVDQEDGALFWSEAENGVRLIQFLDDKYAIVITNPPYMGSANMDSALKKYIELHYKPGKRDTYAAFILRGLELCRAGGRVAMITQQSWMFLRSFADLRALPEDKLVEARRKNQFTGLLRETTIEALAHLGEHAFEDPAAAGAFTAMFVLTNAAPNHDHHIKGIRLIGLKSAHEKANMLRSVAQASILDEKTAF